MDRDIIYDSVEYTGPTFKRLSDEETDRVKRKVRALRDRCLLRPELQDVFDLCDGVILTLMSNGIDCAVVPRLKALFEEHEIAQAESGGGAAEPGWRRVVILGQPTPPAMSTKNRKHAGLARRSDAVPSNQVTLPDTVGTTQPEREIALLERRVAERDAEEDRAANEAVLEEIDRVIEWARRPHSS